MMSERSWPFWALVGFLVIAHFTLHLAVGLGATAPDLLTPAVLLGARRARPSAAAGLGFGLGLLQDSLALESFGVEAVTLTVLGYLGARSRELFVGDSAVFLLLYLFIGKWLHDAIFFLLAGMPDRAGPALWLLVLAPLAAAYAALAGAAAMAVYRAVTGER